MSEQVISGKGSGSFPCVLSASHDDEIASAVLALVDEVAKNEVDKVPDGFEIALGKKIGVHIRTDNSKIKGLFSLRYTQSADDVYEICIRPCILQNETRIRNLACSIFAMMRRGITEWKEKNKQGLPIRISRTAYGMAPDEEKRSRRRAQYQAAGPRTARTTKSEPLW